MNKEVAIKVENLTKIYKLYDKPVDRLKESLNIFGKKYHKDFYALNEVCFEINKGDAVGIVGKNGSGKSTLLKIITGVLTPSSGSVTVNGRVSALLELGAGFNPEYTGLENIYLQGLLMGYDKEAMHTRVDAILRFADIGEFINQPVKGYSSGMFARLAFAVAINVEPDILIVDEALAVGDMVFQAKCMARMISLMERGVTVLFVSHDAHSVKTLCNKAVFLQNGQLVDYGDSARVVGKYVEMQSMQMNDDLKEIDTKIEDSKTYDELSSEDIPVVVSLKPKNLDMSLSQRFGDGRATILNAVILDEDFKPTNELIATKDYYVQIATKFNTSLSTFVIGTSLASLDGIQQISCMNSQDFVTFPSVSEGEVIITTIKVNVPLKAGNYVLNVGCEFPSISNVTHQSLDIINAFEAVRVVFKAHNKSFYSNFYTKGQYFLNRVGVNCEY
ncbi:ABC transporter ATP-binding protein [Francisella philomiragia]|uniref:ABC-type polysaccharide/polyol phosphate transport system ATPase component-like protein n=1 Tax=Francisella philomiragia subsp. philomiragia (strain ATCC 25017 / CCUG 19701 / FSC 153 / O\|nr:ABC transporter ATP-binding protein [Francisella philomiragia]AJI46691.1 ABC transporter family protein [Francisella philomiragia]AJI50075.1 ABC transporter family protein [Francisella philomiragia]MBK2020719.1 ABC transporter ATP-binding protein [Francisella philomiragia]MBK2030861.1 ABC transporter ATP-binding protein [Francisella philomiragia]MBK2263481.1 ABC transporter ATP-binding protein [Francisella philomiragia]